MAEAGQRRFGERGGALIEFAIIAPLLFALLLGTVTGGVSLSRKNSMTNAVREASRFGSTLTESSTWADTTRDRAISLSAGDLSTSQVCVRLVKAPSTVRRTSTGCSAAMLALVPSVSGITAGDCAVLVWARRTSEMEVIFFTQTLTLDAHSVTRYERDCT